MVGRCWCGARNLPGLVPRDPGSPLTRKVVHWLKGGFNCYDIIEAMGDEDLIDLHAIERIIGEGQRK